MKLTKKLIMEMVEDVMNEGKPPGMSSAEFHKKTIDNIMDPEKRKKTPAKRPTDTKSPWRNPLQKEELRKGREADNLLKEIDGWWDPKEIIEMVEGTWSTNSQYRKSGYQGNPTGFDAFFKDKYVGKKFRLEFLSWTRENRWRRKKYGQTIDAVTIAVTDILFNRHPELKEWSNLGVNAPGSPTAKDKYSEHKFRADLILLVKAVIDKNLNFQETLVETIQKSIDALKNLKTSTSVDQKGYTPREV